MAKLFKLKYRILVGYAVPIVLSCGIAGLVYSKAKSVAAISIEVQQAQNTITEIDEMLLGYTAMVRSLRGFTLFPNDETYLKDFEDGSQLFHQASASSNQLIQDSEMRQQVSAIIEKGNKNEKIARQALDLLKVGKAAEAKLLVASVRMHGSLETRTSIVEKQEAILNTKTQQLERAMGWLTLIVAIATVLAAILAISIGLLIASRISKTINQTVSAIASSSTQIAATAEEQERTASQQSASVNETTTTMDELGASSRATAEQAEAAVSAALVALNLTDGGSQAVGQTLEGMFILKERVGAIAQQIVRLSEQANQIGNISDLVSDLANQTNMLALNAAVEAVRAGEHGKGFAVVAAEIRKLADQSKTSAHKIGALVADVQNAINLTVMVTDEGTKTVEEGAKIAAKTSEAFTGVGDAVNNVVLNNQQISLNIKQQAIAIQQVIEAMNALNQGAKETASGITQTKIGTQSLNEVATQLKSLV